MQPDHQPIAQQKAAFQQGAARLIKQAPALASSLAAGGLLGLLAVCSIQPLLVPGVIAIPAIMKLLEALGLNVAAGYLGEALKQVWQRSGRPRAAEATREELADALTLIVSERADAAAEIARIAHDSGALQQTLVAIHRGVDGGADLLAGLVYDSRRHGAALASMRTELRQGLGAIYQLALGIQGDTATIREQTSELLRLAREDHAGLAELARQIAAQQRQQEHDRAQLLDGYLLALIGQYEGLWLSRFVDIRTGADEPTVPRLYLQDVYTGLTTDAPLRLVREKMRSARSVRLLQRYFARKSPDRAPPEDVRLLCYRPLKPALVHRRSTAAPGADVLLADLLQISSADAWLTGDLAEDVPTEARFMVRVLRPELVVEAMAPSQSRPQRMVLLGDPGSGKSTVLRYVAVLMANAWIERRALELPGWNKTRIPLLLPLGPVGERLKQQPDAAKALVEALVDELKGAGALRADLPALLNRLLPNAILLLDGLDELSAEPGRDGELSARRRVALALRRLAHDLPDTPIIVTCRVLPYRTLDSESDAEPWQFPADAGWQERTVQPFAFGQVRSFVASWYRANAQSGLTKQDATAQTANLLQQLSENRSLREAIAPGSAQPTTDPPASPLLLTMLTILHYNSEGHALPLERDTLYEELIRLLLQRWEPRRSLPVHKRDDVITRLNIPGLKTIEPLRLVLHEVAYEAHQIARGGDGRGIINADQLTGRLGRYFRENLNCAEPVASAKAKTFLDILQQEAGLLQALDRNAYALPHLTFQEYLAACHLAEQPAMVDLAYAHWCGSDADRWRVVLLLLMGRLRQQGKVADKGVLWLERLADAECPQPAPGQPDPIWQPKDAAQRQRDALLASDCYDAIGRRANLGSSRKPQVLEKNLCDALLTVIPPPDPLRPPALFLTPPERNRAALFLAQLGDPRPGVCTLQPDWCGPFPARDYAIDEGTTTVQLSEFRIARYPVTVWQFRQFWEANGYANERWWPKSGWTWKQQYGATQPYLWDAPDWMADNQPVVGISWYEAVAFCNWLTAQGRSERWLGDGEVVRLPSEAEWEVAAMWDERAGSMRTWQPPEGEFWQNVAEVGIGRTTPVGLFPQGASSSGALDMAGNIWEWCGSAYDDYPKRAHKLHDDFPANRFGPALRGGAYYLQNIRSSWGARDWINPGNQYNNWGCRVCVCSAPRF